MKLLNAHVINFCSYDELIFDFKELGLTLVQGATGSGKSTLQDISSWVLFGETSKGGAVDEVRSWNADGKPTFGSASVKLGNGDVIQVVRIRGKTNENDLYWYHFKDGSDSGEHRGKDISDTQKLLCELLGVSADVYNTSTNFNEFSAAGTFFVAPAKTRRAIFEKVASLELPARLGERVTANRKVVKKSLQETEVLYGRSSGRLEQLDKAYLAAENSHLEFYNTQARTLQDLQLKSINFEAAQAALVATFTAKSEQFEAKQQRQLADLTLELEKAQKSVQPKKDLMNLLRSYEIQLEQEKAILNQHRCPQCNGPVANEGQQNLVDHLTKQVEIAAIGFERNKEYEWEVEHLQKLIADIQSYENPHKAALEQIASTENTYADQISREQLKVNPFKKHLAEVTKEWTEVDQETTRLASQVTSMEYRLACLNKLYDLSADLRGALLNKTIQNIEVETNRYLEKYFDSELRVQFSMEDSDDLVVGIRKGGYECVYTQLSKGQRQLLRLCFVVSVMQQCANNHGAHFDTLFFDESLDGLDSSLKLKAFGLFQELSTTHGSVLVIDHNEEFHALFTDTIRVTLEGDRSIVEATNG